MGREGEGGWEGGGGRGEGEGGVRAIAPKPQILAPPLDPEEELEVETMYLEDSYSDRNYSISHGWQILFYFKFNSCP